MKGSIKQHYNDYWSIDRGNAEDYDRNLKLQTLFKSGERVLDVGCGSGTVAEFLQKKVNIKITGVDVSEVAIQEAKKRGIDARVIDAEGKLPFQDNSFDVVLWGDNIEHLFNPMKTLKDIHKVLKTGGRIIISCPNMAYWRYRIYYFLRGNLPDTEWSDYPRWFWSHIRFFDFSTLKEMLVSAGFKNFKIIGISSRRLDKPLLKLWPSMFGMIMLVQAEKSK